jgi:hypothetical protein
LDSPLARRKGAPRLIFRRIYASIASVHLALSNSITHEEALH